MNKFYVINWDVNKKKFAPYDIMPYLRSTYDDYKKRKDNEYFKLPKTKEEFKKFVDKELMYQFWGRCEYEIILVDWPCQTKEEKIDIYQQCKLNIDIIVNLLMEDVKQEKL